MAPGQVGELTVRGAPVIRGYLNREDATAETIVDGFLRTGDVARVDENGFVYVVDRKKDMVLRGGENVYCAEVESAIYEVDGVAECIVFGVPDDRLGEVGSVIVLKSGVEVDPEALRADLLTRIAKHKVPRYLWVQRESLPAYQRQVPEARSEGNAGPCGGLIRVGSSHCWAAQRSPAALFSRRRRPQA